MLIEDVAEALLLEGLRVQDLIAAALIERQWDQDIRLLQCQQLADDIGTGAGNHDVREGVEISESVGQKLVLLIARRVGERCVEVALPADVDHVVLLKELRQHRAERCVDRHGA